MDNKINTNFGLHRVQGVNHNMEINEIRGERNSKRILPPLGHVKVNVDASVFPDTNIAGIALC